MIGDARSNARSHSIAHSSFVAFDGAFAFIVVVVRATQRDAMGLTVLTSRMDTTPLASFCHSRKRPWMTLLVVVFACAFASRASASVAIAGDAPRSSANARALLGNSKYSANDRVVLYANKVGPFHNPSEVRGIDRRRARRGID